MPERHPWRVTYVDALTGEFGATCRVSDSAVARYFDHLDPLEVVRLEDGSIQAGDWRITLEVEDVGLSQLAEGSSENDQTSELITISFEEWEAA